MDNQEVFDALSDLEEAMYYRMQNPEHLPFDSVTEIHEKIKAALLEWHRITGCTNQ